MPLMLLSSIAIATPALAAEAASAPSAVPTAPVATSTAAPATTPRPRLISAEVAANLNAAADQIATPGPATANLSPTPSAAVAAPNADPVATSPDRPRNTIYRVPDFVRSAPTKVDSKRERAMLTPLGELDLAYKRRPGLRYTSLPIPFLNNDGVALMMLAEDDRLERIKEMENMLTLTRDLDPAAYKKTKDAVDAAKVRSR